MGEREREREGRCETKRERVGRVRMDERENLAHIDESFPLGDRKL